VQPPSPPGRQNSKGNNINILNKKQSAFDTFKIVEKNKRNFNKLIAPRRVIRNPKTLKYLLNKNLFTFFKTLKQFLM